MKKIFLLAIAVVLGIGANAQILSSRTVSHKKTESNMMWYVKAGVSILNATAPDDDADGLKSTVGPDLTVGFHKPISTTSFYWGMDLGIGTRGFKYGEKFLAWDLRFSPITVGYKYAINDVIKLDGHFGGFLSYDFAHNDNADEVFDDFDAGFQIGAGVWFNRFNLDVTYQRGFCDMIGTSKSSNVLIRLGYAF